MAKPTRLPYLAFRCARCGRPITAYQIERAWDKAAKVGQHPNLCKCGASKVSPGNFTLFEELTRPSIWELWWKAIVLPKVGL